MRLKTILLLAVAGTCGLVAMLGVQQVLSNNTNEVKGQAVAILIATAEILPGQALDEKNTEFKQMPVEVIPEGAVTKPEQVKERALKVRVFPGDLITEVKLDRKGSRNASSDVPKGMRAVSIPIDPTMTGTGLIHQGDKVDVLVTHRSLNAGRDQGIGKEVKTVLECIEVFAIDGQRDSSAAAFDKTATQIKNVSLLVNSAQAKLLKLAGGVGDLHLTLRGSNDDQRLDEKELFDPQLAVPDMVIERERNEEEPHRTVSQTVTIEKPAAEPKTPKWKIEIFRGSERVTEEVDLQDADDSESAPTAAIVERQQQPPSQQHLQQKQSKQSQLKQLQQLSGQPWMGTIRKLFGG